MIFVRVTILSIRDTWLSGLPPGGVNITIQPTLAFMGQTNGHTVIKYKVKIILKITIITYTYPSLSIWSKCHLLRGMWIRLYQTLCLIEVGTMECHIFIIIQIVYVIVSFKSIMFSFFMAYIEHISTHTSFKCLGIWWSTLCLWAN